MYNQIVMKKILLAGLVVGWLGGLVVGVSFAGTLKTYTYPELSMKAPASLTVNKNNFKTDFPTAGCCYIRPKAIAVMIVTEKLPDQTSMQNSMVKLSGLPLNNWQLADQASKDARGWVWRKDYQIIIGDKAVYTVLGHGVKDAYLIMLCADKADFTANQSDYQAWRNSLRVVNSNPGKPR